MKAPTRTTFRWYRISYFLKTLWLTTSSLVTCSKTPSCQRKKKVSEEVYHVCPKNLNNFSGGFRIKADSLMCISPKYHISGKAIKPRNQSRFKKLITIANLQQFRVGHGQNLNLNPIIQQKEYTKKLLLHRNF